MQEKKKKKKVIVTQKNQKKKKRERILCLNFVCFASKVFLFFEYLSVINFY